MSVLPISSKVMEKILFTRLSYFSNSHSAITPSQYGFKSGMSTETALLNQNEYILGNIENKNFPLGVFVTFKEVKVNSIIPLC